MAAPKEKNEEGLTSESFLSGSVLCFFATAAAADVGRGIFFSEHYISFIGKEVRSFLAHSLQVSRRIPRCHAVQGARWRASRRTNEHSGENGRGCSFLGWSCSGFVGTADFEKEAGAHEKQFSLRQWVKIRGVTEKIES